MLLTVPSTETFTVQEFTVELPPLVTVKEAQYPPPQSLLILTDPVTPPPVPPVLDELELEELDDELLEELLVVVEPEELLLLEELEEDELLLEEELVAEPDPPLQLPAAAPLPTTCRVSIFAKPAELVELIEIRLLPATKLTVAVAELDHEVHAPVPSNARLATALPLTTKLPERAVEPLA